MTCETMEGELVPFHFGTLEETARDAVEQHLLGCARCLQTYLALKRVIDDGGSLRPRPSAATRGRLRGDVAAEFARPRVRRVVLGAVAAALVAALGLGMYLERNNPPEPPSAPSVGNQPIDTARPVTAEPQFL